MANKNSLPVELFTKAYRVTFSGLAASFYQDVVITAKAAPNQLEKFIDGVLNMSPVPLAISEEQLANPANVAKRSALIMSEYRADVKAGLIATMYLGEPITIRDDFISLHP